MTGLAIAQGIYLVATGLWSLLFYRSFERVTGPKTDVWLVKTVAGLVLGVGIGLLAAAYRSGLNDGVMLIALTTAAALLASDVVYVWQRVIPPVYSIDASLQAMFCAAWAVALMSG